MLDVPPSQQKLPNIFAKIKEFPHPLFASGLNASPFFAIFI